MQANKTIQRTTCFGLVALLLGLAAPLLAHEAKTSSTPADGAIVEDAPATIGVEFDGAMRITQFEVTGPEGPVGLASRPGNQPTQQYFVEPEETLSPGDYQVHWRGMAGDGHMMSGGFGFTVGE